MTPGDAADSSTSANAPAAGQTRLVIVGASGMVGGSALRYALDEPAVTRVLAIGRRPVAISHPKLVQIAHQDFANCSSLAGALSDHSAAIFCLGTYTGAVPDDQLRKVTVNFPIEFARVLHASSPRAAFSFLSGNGADPTERSRIAFARYKGAAENALTGIGFPRLFIFRPAYIYPVEPRREPNLGYRVLRAVYPAFRLLFPNQVVRSDDLARAMVDCTIRRPGAPGRVVFENRDIRAFARTSVHAASLIYP
jgi:uncharacterized protein YbjT (DUF2867 family)